MWEWECLVCVFEREVRKCDRKRKRERELKSEWQGRMEMPIVGDTEYGWRKDSTVQCSAV